VNVSVSISPTVPPKQGFGTAAIVTNENTLLAAPQVERIVFYASIAEVAVDWSNISETYLAAQAYFSQSPSPTRFATILQDPSGTPETEVEALAAAELVSNDWYGVLLLKTVRDVQAQLDVAAWVQARTKVFSACSNDVTTLTLGNITGNPYVALNNGYTRTSFAYSSNADQYPDAAVLGKAFTTDFNSPDSVITLKFKSLAGIQTEAINTSQKAGLDEKRCNVLTDVAGASMFTEGYMSSQLFFDEIHYIDWQTGEIESNVFSYLLSRTTKVPFTDKGATALEQQVIKALDAGVNNGGIGAGTTIEGEFLGNGYKVVTQKVADVAPADKANRIAPDISFVAILTGAMHSIQINGTVER